MHQNRYHYFCGRMYVVVLCNSTRGTPYPDSTMLFQIPIYARGYRNPICLRPYKLCRGDRRIAAASPHRQYRTPGTTDDLMYEYSWYEVTVLVRVPTACLHACREAGRKAGIPNEFQTNSKRIPNAPRPTMRAPVSTCSAVQYRTTCREAGRKAGIPNESRTNPKQSPNEARTHPVRQ